MDKKTGAIVLCAGMGSRLGLPGNLNKCAVPVAGTSPVRHTAAALKEAGVDRITVVLGHAAGSVRNSLSAYRGFGQINFAENRYFDKHGCNYSLACGMADENMARADRVIIAEGDSLLHGRSVAQLVSTDAEAASLVRSKRYLDPARSVMAVGHAGKITRYEYDMSHRGLMPELGTEEHIIGESMQLWLFSGRVLKRLRELLMKYREEADRNGSPLNHSGVYSINMLEESIEPVFSERPEDWINLNTQEDLRKAGNVSWLIK